MHLSDPTKNNDGWDFLCQRAEIQLVEEFSLEGAGCYNLAPNHGGYVMVGAWYEW